MKYRVSGSWVRLLKQRRRETGEIAPRVQRHGRRRMLEPHLHTLAALIAEQPDRTLAELKDALGTPASLATIWRAVAALDVTVKKTVRPSEHDRPDVAAARVAWHAEAPAWDPTRLVFPSLRINPAAKKGMLRTISCGLAHHGRARPRGPGADQYVSRGAAGHRPDRARGLRRRHRRGEFPRLYRNRSSCPRWLPGTS